MLEDMPDRKPLVWVASSLDDLSAFPRPVRLMMGYALHVAQLGGRHPHSKPLRGFGGAGVLEVAEDHDGQTYRAVYTVRFHDRVYVLHVFEKKSKRGIATPKKDIDLVKRRLKEAEAIHREWLAAQGGE
jgi:phage-related protein